MGTLQFKAWELIPMFQG